MAAHRLRCEHSRGRSHSRFSLYVPLAGSPALNHGNDAACASAPVNKLDAFGQRRPQNASCTIGAVEYHIEHLPYLDHRELSRQTVHRPGKLTP